MITMILLNLFLLLLNMVGVHHQMSNITSMCHYYNLVYDPISVLLLKSGIIYIGLLDFINLLPITFFIPKLKTSNSRLVKNMVAIIVY